MPLKNLEARKEYNKKYRINNKEHLREKAKEYNIANRERINNQQREYYSNNKEYYKEYNKSEKGKISDWKSRGLISDNYELIYERYTNSKNCEECNCEYSNRGDGVGRFKCMDHCHITGKFRNILCNTCNLRRR